MPHYPIQTNKILNNFFNFYIKDVLAVADNMEINLRADNFFGDHLGLQVLSAEEFDKSHIIFLGYAEMIHDNIIHNRRNRVYRFKKPLEAEGITMPKIEIFEPKPEADISKLRPGIEHISFVVKNYDSFLEECKQKNISIDKVIDMGGSKFFKTKLIDNVEIEFRNDKLGE